MKPQTALRIVRALLRAVLYILLAAVVLATMTVCLCCFDPEQPGFVCDRPGLCMASGAILFAAIASIVGMATSDSKL